MSQRPSDADALADHMAGYAAYWSGLPLESHRGQTWRLGWLGAAQEAARHKGLIDNVSLLRSALQQAEAAIRSLMPAKPSIRQRHLADAARHDIAQALALLAPPASETRSRASSRSGGDAAGTTPIRATRQAP